MGPLLLLLLLCRMGRARAATPGEDMYADVSAWRLTGSKEDATLSPPSGQGARPPPRGLVSAIEEGTGVAVALPPWVRVGVGVKGQSWGELDTRGQNLEGELGTARADEGRPEYVGEEGAVGGSAFEKDPSCCCCDSRGGRGLTAAVERA